ncbi:MAG: iron-sulfur cluster assembly scaffold protein [Deltaproteobacteria bacterium]|nr:iron-sulfur cluster assembly scaffold protein [Deltaproteobacteria bacterium]
MDHFRDPVRGDFLEVTIRVNGQAREVSDVNSRCRGCPTAIASGSMMTTLYIYTQKISTKFPA